MASVNRVILVGNLGADPDLRYAPSGEAVVTLRLATTDRFKDKSGQMVTQTEWHSVVFHGREAEICGQYLKKGKEIYVEGRIQTRKWKDRGGVDQYKTEIKGTSMQMLGGRAGDVGSREPPADASPVRSPSPSPTQGLDDDLPKF